MRIAITGGTGFLGGYLARALSGAGHEVVLIARGADRRDPAVLDLPGARFAASDLGDAAVLAAAFEGATAVAHLAGINRERGAQTFERVHVEGTRNVVEAARRAGVERIALTSFLRARPGTGSPYHESKWRAEELLRASGLDFTVLKPGGIYGRGDHLLDHLARGLELGPLFPLVGFRELFFRPVAVEDVIRILVAALVEGRLSRRTIHVLGPETLPLREGIRRVARVLGKRPILFGFPVRLQLLLAWAQEWLMAMPLASRAQVRMLAEGLAEPAPPCDPPPPDLLPREPFGELQIRRGLPARV